MNEYKCPKCGAKLERFWDLPDAFDESVFRCNGHLIQPVPYPHISPYSALNRTKSCGYFSLDELEKK
ncbi:hypothetical protein ACLQ91_01965 [Avibacterium endocarditidis]|uniref:hypothetical protein n=1 Tax=Avibacterium endocarditidis TaxID=380674 RepID=UPI0039FDA78A